MKGNIVNIGILPFVHTIYQPKMLKDGGYDRD